MRTRRTAVPASWPDVGCAAGGKQHTGGTGQHLPTAAQPAATYKRAINNTRSSDNEFSHLLLPAAARHTCCTRLVEKDGPRASHELLCKRDPPALASGDAAVALAADAIVLRRTDKGERN